MDISSRQDIEKLINEFYSRLLKVDEIKPIFEGLDFEKHVPEIVSFWCFVLLDHEGYKTNVFEKHMHLSIQPHMFETWLKVWTETVNSLFQGEIAELAKQRATVLTFTFKSKWEKLHS